MEISWVNTYMGGQYAVARDKEIEKALSDCGYDFDTVRQLKDEGRLKWYRENTFEEINTIYLDGCELFQIIGQCSSSGPQFKKVAFKRKEGKT